MEERLLCTQGVIGSNPFTSTSFVEAGLKPAPFEKFAGDVARFRLLFDK